VPSQRGVPLITLSSDLGWAYAAQMRAVLAHWVPPGHVVDLSHDLPAHAVGEAAFLLRAMGAGFPARTVHVAVVDPGVGGRRLPIAVACEDGSVLVGPDNGVLEPLAERLGAPHAYRILPERLRANPRVGSTFDGRDLFAPAAGAIARGRKASELGPPVRLKAARLPPPVRTRDGARGEIVHVDRFGNLITNIPTEWAPPTTAALDLAPGVGRSRRAAWSTHYEALPPGELGAVGSSFGLIELTVARGRAADVTGLATGVSVRVTWVPAATSSPRRE
jgi:S-adenosyl-L-methionine hydrolase (adenosine-forming)